MNTEGPLYQERLASQIAQYKDVKNIHELPDIFHYWSMKYLQPKVERVFEIPNSTEVFARALIGKKSANDHSFSFASLGAGDCSLEISVAQQLAKIGTRDFCIDAFELSQPLLDRAESAIKTAGLVRHFKLVPCDINEHEIQDDYDGVMAHHSLHHFVALERIFDNVKRVLCPEANFVICDTIGRNGHMRWPESEQLIELFWRTLPDEKKFHHQLQTLWDEFINFDCSQEGFEGIRAQDILPLLVKKFHFSHFIATGGLVDVFIDRGVGHNFDIKDKRDIAFVDLLEHLNQLLLDAGAITPTWMFAILRNEPCECKYDRHQTPQHCVRWPTLAEEGGSAFSAVAPSPALADETGRVEVATATVPANGGGQMSRTAGSEGQGWPAGELGPFQLAGQALSRERLAAIEDILDCNCRNEGSDLQRFFRNYNYTEFSGPSFWVMAYHIELQAAFMPSQGHILDLGCLGPELVALRQVRPDVRADGLSIEGGIFGLEEIGFCSYPTPQGHSISVCSIDAERDRFPFENNTFDVVSSFEMIEHLKFGPQNFMREIHRVLKENGLLVITTPNAASICSIWKHCKGEHPASHHRYFRDLKYGVVHPFEYRASELAALVKAYGFDILAATAFYKERYVGMAEELSRVADFIESLGFSPSEAELGEQLLIVARKSGPIVDEYPPAIFEG